MNSDDALPKRLRFLTVEQVADELSVGVPTVRQLLKSGELRGLQIGGRGIWRVGAQDVEDFIEHAYRITADRIAAGEVPDDEPPVGSEQR
ncbi:helix-turn-helix domain-containing protein [Arthrobacter sp. D5-1]|uniref:helix-turn-helix domain-containing protein n=1 Tax=Arthrobacter sp. D5-1 TaxID=1477518 RepID=UPI001A994EDF|nr:helix-turn-helix domain-containing protein [Arthrobacter sp. D5-1]QSZ49578.1 excisionase [Arthrobacter sp. D5-1]